LIDLFGLKNYQLAYAGQMNSFTLLRALLVWDTPWLRHSSVFIWMEHSFNSLNSSRCGLYFVVFNL
jgi:hypothetical protein